MPADLKDKHWIGPYNVKGHYRYYKKGHSARVAKANAAKLKARHKRAAKLKKMRKRK